ncbi:pyruvate kinase [Porphyromonas crevioricanis]|uniref:Pyruvate kinase n=1 Tax=Porphyromonas crevioricanis TaxID=393921 RepID=A0AB34PHV5_9PORP|nr:pyruvate kinase [Porphyromonas crevioricanis]KGN95931.1 pyruvate kinase [Porphyromonas crevioricanis]
MKQTKIVATISDLRCEKDFLTRLINAGVNVVRLNTAHMDEEGMDRIIDRVRSISSFVGILMDTKGPEVRTTTVESPIVYREGDNFYIKGDPSSISTKECLSVNYTNFVRDVNVGSCILIDDGILEIEVLERIEDRLYCRALNDGEIGSRKSVNVPGVRINLPSLTERDKRYIDYAIRKDIDFIAHSFVRSAQDVLDIQKILDAAGSHIKIIAKIENQEGVDNADEILKHAYGMMIARGDLGIEVPQEKIPALQRQLIRKCVEHQKPVIVATQMLHTMIENPRPTRAEVTDVANAIYYRTDAVMLSGETAKGRYPEAAVETMKRIILEAEKSKLEANDIRVPFGNDDLDTTSFLAKQAVKSVAKLGVKAIVTDSFTGRTARVLAAFRGKVPIYAICYNERVTRQLTLSHGVWTSYQPLEKGSLENLSAALKHLILEGMIKPDDLVAYISGRPGRESSSTGLEIDQVCNLIERKCW